MRNFESCINHARGYFIHILHGDDKISPGFYAEVGQAFRDYPEAGACFVSYDYIDRTGMNIRPIHRLQTERGIIDNWLEKIAASNLIQPPAIAVKREVYEQLGSFFAVHYGEDWEMWVRIATHYPVAYIPKFLAHYREHDHNITTNSILTGQNIRDIQKVIRIINGYLPERDRARLRKQASRNFSAYFATLSDKIYHGHRQRRAAVKQAYLSLRMHVNPVTIKHMIKILAKCAINYKRNKTEIHA